MINLVDLIKEDEIDDNGNGKHFITPGMSNRDMVDTYVSTLENESTIGHYRRYLYNFLEFVGEYPIRDLKSQHLISWMEQRQKDVGTLQKTTIKSYLTCVSSFFKFINENGYDMPKNPALPAMKKLTKGAKNNSYTPLAIPDIQKIMHNTVSPRDRAIILILFKTGCRISEITHLQMDDVRMDEGYLIVRNRKHHSADDESRIPIDAELHSVLDFWIRNRPNPCQHNNLFVSYFGKSLTTTRMREIVKTRGKAAGIDNVHSHRFRYSFTTILSINQCPAGVIATLRGDSAKTMVEHYTQPTWEDIKKHYLLAMPEIL